MAAKRPQAIKRLRLPWLKGWQRFEVSWVSDASPAGSASARRLLGTGGGVKPQPRGIPHRIRSFCASLGEFWHFGFRFRRGWEGMPAPCSSAPLVPLPKSGLSAAAERGAASFLLQGAPCCAHSLTLGG